MSATSAFSQAPRQEQPLLVVRPRFVPDVVIASTIPLTIFFTLWGGGFCGGLFYVLVDKQDVNTPTWFPFVACALSIFFGLPLLVLIGTQRMYAHTEYRFYRDRLEFEEGFWTIERKMIPYDRITEITFKQGVIQRRYGLGTIELLTAGTATRPQQSGIELRDIPNPNEVYEQVKALIHTT
ncbi:MAG: PH domain-containing protein [Ardenticatenia bacterium]|nr:MAG: PH domain-containing protein [Ardenticatenia bacterium]